MSVKVRGKAFHYRFMVDGVKYSGRCDGCDIRGIKDPKKFEEIQNKAFDFEEKVRAEVAKEAERIRQANEDIRKNKTVRALIENYKFERQADTRSG